MKDEISIEEMLFEAQKFQEKIERISSTEPPNGFFIGTDENLESAIKCYKEKNYEKTFELLNVSFSNGNLRASFFLGDMYYYGINVSRDRDIAHEYYKKGEEHGDPWAKFNISWMFVEDNYNNGRSTYRLFEAISNLNSKDNKEQMINNESKFELGLLYYKGENTKRDLKKAKKIFGELAMKGDAKSQYYLGEIFHHKKDYSSAIKWYGKSALNDNSEAQYSLATLLFEGNDYGLIPNKEKALEWYRKSAENGNVRAQFTLGKLLFKEKNNENKEEGLYWIRKASEQGSVSAIQYLEFIK